MPNQAIATYVTQWTYDSHNRLLEMIYPDEEKVTYTYDMGGQLTNVHGYKSYGYDYVNRIGYDKFGQRTYMKYCNGAETFYTYEPQRRRLQGLKVNAGGNTIMDNAYTYDAVSNVLGVTNGAALPQSGKSRRTDEPQLHLRRAVPPVKRHWHLHGRGQQDGKLHTGNGLR